MSTEITEKSITLSRSCKVNLGNYQSTDFFVSMSADIEPGQSASEVYKELLKRVKSALAGQLAQAGENPQDFLL